MLVLSRDGGIEDRKEDQEITDRGWNLTRKTNPHCVLGLVKCSYILIELNRSWLGRTRSVENS